MTLREERIARIKAYQKKLFPGTAHLDNTNYDSYTDEALEKACRNLQEQIAEQQSLIAKNKGKKDSYIVTKNFQGHYWDNY